VAIGVAKCSSTSRLRKSVLFWPWTMAAKAQYWRSTNTPAWSSTVTRNCAWRSCLSATASGHRRGLALLGAVGVIVWAWTMPAAAQRTVHGVSTRSSVVVAGHPSGGAVVVSQPGSVVVASTAAAVRLPSGYIAVLPAGHTIVVVGGTRYYYVGGVHYRAEFCQGRTVDVRVRL
jgi:hypothetical protein